MLIKKIFRLAAVLCLFFFSAQIAQAQEQLKGQELVNWISARTWILVEFTDTKGRTGTYGAEYPLEDLMLKASDSRFDGCNTCYRNLKFDVALSTNYFHHYKIQSHGLIFLSLFCKLVEIWKLT